MVYCVNCGAKNSDDATICSQCGRSIMKVEPKATERVETQRFERRTHFGGVLVGLFLIVIGLLFFFEQFVPLITQIFWPLVLIFVGTAIILSGIRRHSRE